jgi:hypothetical protein
MSSDKDNHIHLLDNLKCNSKPIDIPKKKNYIKVATDSHEMILLVQSVSHDLIKGEIINSPPNNKPYNKNDLILIHRNNILALKK